MRSFHRNRSLETIFHFLKVFVTLLLFYHSSFFPILLQSFSHIYDLSITVFSNSFFAFLILNAIILFLYILSNQNGNVSDEDDTYNHNHNQNQNQFLKITAPELVTDPVESLPEKQQDQVVEMASPEKQRDLCPVFKETVTAVTETTTTTMTCCTTVTTSRDDDDKVSISEKKCYRRVQSEFYERRELKKELCYVENMSKEEFNRTVEEFIAKHKRMQREEHEQLRSQKTEYLALVP